MKKKKKKKKIKNNCLHFVAYSKCSLGLQYPRNVLLLTVRYSVILSTGKNEFLKIFSRWLVLGEKNSLKKNTTFNTKNSIFL